MDRIPNIKKEGEIGVAERARSIFDLYEAKYGETPITALSSILSDLLFNARKSGSDFLGELEVALDRYMEEFGEEAGREYGRVLEAFEKMEADERREQVLRIAHKVSQLEGYTGCGFSVRRIGCTKVNRFLNPDYIQDRRHNAIAVASMVVVAASFGARIRYAQVKHDGRFAIEFDNDERWQPLGDLLWSGKAPTLPGLLKSLSAKERRELVMQYSLVLIAGVMGGLMADPFGYLSRGASGCSECFLRGEEDCRYEGGGRRLRKGDCRFNSDESLMKLFRYLDEDMDEINPDDLCDPSWKLLGERWLDVVHLACELEQEHVILGEDFSCLGENE
jgi:hypothetical protein